MTMPELQGRRIPYSNEDFPPDIRGFEPGDYLVIEHNSLRREVWFKDPFGKVGRATKHTIDLHDDGTVSVHPSIADDRFEDGWHGYLTKGVWLW